MALLSDSLVGMVMASQKEIRVKCYRTNGNIKQKELECTRNSFIQTSRLSDTRETHYNQILITADT